MKLLTNLSFILIILCFSTNVFADKSPIKFGKVSSDEIKMKVYEPDTSAVAVILCDYGLSNFMYTEANGFQVHYNRTLRIKILKKEGYEWAKREIMFRSKYDQISKLKGYSFTLEDGKVVKTKLERSQIYNEEYNKYWDITKFEMPNIKVGSVIDIEYVITSDLWRIKDWYFQEEIPTKYSYYEVRIPEYFTFKKLQKGYIPIEINQSTTNDFISISTTHRTGGNVTRTEISNSRIDFNRNDFIMKASDVPAFKKESYLTSMYNYLAAIEFELQDYRFPHGSYNNVTATWKQIGIDLMKDEDFGFQLKKGGFLKDKIASIESQSSNKLDKAQAMYYYLQNELNWNKLNGIYAENISKTWDDKSGDAADINILLTAALKKMDLDAKPVIISTRSHGMIHPAQIMVDQFNYVIASVNIDGTTYLLDATDKYTPFGILPQRCLNEKGRTIDINGGDWVEIKPAFDNSKTYQSALTFEDGVITGQIKEIYKNYAAIKTRASFANSNSDEDFIESYQDNFTETELTLDTISGKEDILSPISINYEFETETLSENAGNLLLINPFFSGSITENPYKLDKREYPVDYSYPRSISHMTTIDVPEGYEVEELPKPVKLGLPNNSAIFLYTIQQSGNKIVVVSRFKINKTQFLPEEYQNLKEFYNIVIDNQSKQLIFKKI